MGVGVIWVREGQSEGFSCDVLTEGGERVLDLAGLTVITFESGQNRGCPVEEADKGGSGCSGMGGGSREKRFAIEGQRRVWRRTDKRANIWE